MKFRIGKGIFEPLAWPAPVRPRRLKASRTHVPLYMGDVIAGPPPLAGAGRPRARPGLGPSHAGRGVLRALARRAAAPAPPAAAVPARTAPARCRVAAPAALRHRAPPAPGRAGCPAAGSPLGGRFDPEAPLHPLDRLGVVIHKHEPPAQLGRHRPERPAPGEGIEAPVTRARRGLDEAPQNALG